MSGQGKIMVVGVGPGSLLHMTERARTAILHCDVVVGYDTYIELVRELIDRQMVIRAGMTEEVSRAQQAVEQAEAGKSVAVISSGDAGLYGMAGLVYEVLAGKGWQPGQGLEVEIIPGITAILSAASLLGAPAMHDVCTISLSDHLTPWQVIAERLEAAARADFVIALYNPRSGRRTRQLSEAREILLNWRDPATPVGLVKSAYRDEQQVILTTLGELPEREVGMLTTVLIGNSTTYLLGDKMITPRGYQRKYDLAASEQKLRLSERMRSENEPWALAARGKKPEIGAAAGPMPESRRLAFLALQCLHLAREKKQPAVANPPALLRPGNVRLELAVSPGLAEKSFSAAQLALLASLLGDHGQMEYTADHYLLLRLQVASEAEAGQVRQKLQEAGLHLPAFGSHIFLKACDFCDLQKTAPLPALEQLQKILAAYRAPHELRIGFNGCGMSCYGALHEDIAVIYRRGEFEIYTGGKSLGRDARAATLVAAGLDDGQMLQMTETLVREYCSQAHAGERYYKYYSRRQEN